MQRRSALVGGMGLFLILVGTIAAEAGGGRQLNALSTKAVFPGGAPTTAYQNFYDIVGVTGEGDNQQLIAGNFINDLVGATAFYGIGVFDTSGNVTGIFGQDTYTAHIDAGLPWVGPTGHSTLTGVVVNGQTQFVGTGATDQLDGHPTAIAMAIVGGGDELKAGTVANVRVGIAPWTNFCAGATATDLQPSGEFSTTPDSFLSTYQHFASATWSRTIEYYYGMYSETFTAPTDVINTSFGFTDPAGVLPETIAVDALARQHPTTTFVVSAGNSGPTSNTVGGPASGYNVITVGSSGDMAFDGTTNGVNRVSDFSSRGPQQYADPQHGTIDNARAPVDLVAPGQYLLLADYTGNLTDTNAGRIWSGTSFSAPIVASGVSLLDSLAYHVPIPLWGLDDATVTRYRNVMRDSRIIKAVLMNSADKLPGWDNAQHLEGNTTVTTQAVDYAQGAGRVNLTKAVQEYFFYAYGDFDGTGGTVGPTGWSLGKLSPGNHRDYAINTRLAAGVLLDVTLDWFRYRNVPTITNGDWDTSTESDLGMANFDLEIWDASFQTLYATSKTMYNDVEHLHYFVPLDGNYGLRVIYLDQVFGIPDPDGETYGLAWSIPVPEPGTLILLVIALAVVPLWRRKRRRT